jgi:hypothetical protein
MAPGPGRHPGSASSQTCSGRPNTSCARARPLDGARPAGVRFPPLREETIMHEQATTIYLDDAGMREASMWVGAFLAGFRVAADAPGIPARPRLLVRLLPRSPLCTPSATCGGRIWSCTCVSSRLRISPACRDAVPAGVHAQLVVPPARRRRRRRQQPRRTAPPTAASQPPPAVAGPQPAHRPPHRR